MTYAVLRTSIPTRFFVGESVSWKWSNSNFPATSWTLVYTLVGASAARLQIAATADGSDHLIEVPSTTTDDYTPGEYTWQAHVSDGNGQRYKVDEGVLTIVADFAEHDTGYDARSHVKKVLDALEAAIEGRASKTQIQQTIDGVSIQHMTLEEQVNLRDRYALKYRKELAAARGENSRRTIKARFVN